jgi:hypothetical protein
MAEDNPPDTTQEEEAGEATPKDEASEVAGLLLDIDDSPFSPEAFLRLENEIGLFADDLAAESVRVAERGLADTVSAAHVERARERLTGPRRSDRMQYANSFGGVLLGAAVSGLVSMALDDTFTTVPTLVLAVLGIVGTGLMVYTIARNA